MWIKLILTPFIAAFSALFYRLGGASHDDFPNAPKWLITGVTRDIGCTLCSLIQLYVWVGVPSEWWQLAGYILVGWWGLKSYWDWFNTWIYDIHYLTGKMTTPYFMWHNFYADKHWWNWLLSGLTMSARWLFICQAWWVYVYVILNAVLIMLWREKINQVDIEETGTGALFII